MVRLVVEDQPMRAAPLAAAQFSSDTLEPCRIGLEVLRLDALIRLARVLDDLDRFPGFHDLGAIPVDGVRLLFRQAMPVGDHHLAAAQLFHAVRRDELARPVEADIAQRRVEFLQPLADRDVRTDNQDRV